MFFTDADLDINVDRFVADNYEFRIVYEINVPYSEVNVTQVDDRLLVMVTNDTEHSPVRQTTEFEMSREAATALKNWLIEQGY